MPIPKDPIIDEAPTLNASSGKDDSVVPVDSSSEAANETYEQSSTELGISQEVANQIKPSNSTGRGSTMSADNSCEIVEETSGIKTSSAQEKTSKTKPSEPAVNDSILEISEVAISTSIDSSCELIENTDAKLGVSQVLVNQKERSSSTGTGTVLAVLSGEPLVSVRTRALSLDGKLFRIFKNPFRTTPNQTVSNSQVRPAQKAWM